MSIAAWPTGEEDYDIEATSSWDAYSAARFCCAYLVETGEFVNIRCLNAEVLTSSDERLEAEQKAAILSQQFFHPNIYRPFTHFVTKSHPPELWTVGPYTPQGSVRDLMDTTYPHGCDETLSITILRAVLRGLAYLHSQGYVHGKVKSDSVVITDTNDICLTSLQFVQNIHEDGQCDGQLHFHPLDHTSLPWLAPEVLAQDLSGYGTSADIYSVGVLAYELLTGENPFEGLDPAQMLLYKYQDVQFEPMRGFSRGFRSFLSACMHTNPLERPHAEDLLHHNIFKQAKKPSSVMRKYLPKGSHPIITIPEESYHLGLTIQEPELPENYSRHPFSELYSGGLSSFSGPSRDEVHLHTSSVSRTQQKPPPNTPALPVDSIFSKRPRSFSIGNKSLPPSRVATDPHHHHLNLLKNHNLQQQQQQQQQRNNLAINRPYHSHNSSPRQSAWRINDGFSASLSHTGMVGGEHTSPPSEQRRSGWSLFHFRRDSNKSSGSNTSRRSRSPLGRGSLLPSGIRTPGSARSSFANTSHHSLELFKDVLSQSPGPFPGLHSGGEGDDEESDADAPRPRRVSGDLRRHRRTSSWQRRQKLAKANSIDSNNVHLQQQHQLQNSESRPTLSRSTSASGRQFSAQVNRGNQQQQQPQHQPQQLHALSKHALTRQARARSASPSQANRIVATDRDESSLRSVGERSRSNSNGSSNAVSFSPMSLKQHSGSSPQLGSSPPTTLRLQQQHRTSSPLRSTGKAGLPNVTISSSDTPPSQQRVGRLSKSAQVTSSPTSVRKKSLQSHNSYDHELAIAERRVQQTMPPQTRPERQRSAPAESSTSEPTNQTQPSSQPPSQPSSQPTQLHHRLVGSHPPPTASTPFPRSLYNISEGHTHHLSGLSLTIQEEASDLEEAVGIGEKTSSEVSEGTAVESITNEACNNGSDDEHASDSTSNNRESERNDQQQRKQPIPPAQAGDDHVGKILHVGELLLDQYDSQDSDTADDNDHNSAIGGSGNQVVPRTSGSPERSEGKMVPMTLELLKGESVDVRSAKRSSDASPPAHRNSRGSSPSDYGVKEIDFAHLDRVDMDPTPLGQLFEEGGDTRSAARQSLKQLADRDTDDARESGRDSADEHEEGMGGKLLKGRRRDNSLLTERRGQNEAATLSIQIQSPSRSQSHSAPASSLLGPQYSDVVVASSSSSQAHGDVQLHYHNESQASSMEQSRMGDGEEARLSHDAHDVSARSSLSSTQPKKKVFSGRLRSHSAVSEPVHRGRLPMEPLSPKRPLSSVVHGRNGASFSAHGGRHGSYHQHHRRSHQPLFQFHPAENSAEAQHHQQQQQQQQQKQQQQPLEAGARRQSYAKMRSGASSYSMADSSQHDSFENGGSFDGSFSDASVIVYSDEEVDGHADDHGDHGDHDRTASMGQWSSRSQSIQHLQRPLVADRRRYFSTFSNRIEVMPSSTSLRRMGGSSCSSFEFDFTSDDESADDAGNPGSVENGDVVGTVRKKKGPKMLKKKVKKVKKALKKKPKAAHAGTAKKSPESDGQQSQHSQSPLDPPGSSRSSSREGRDAVQRRGPRQLNLDAIFSTLPNKARSSSDARDAVALTHVAAAAHDHDNDEDDILGERSTTVAASDTYSSFPTSPSREARASDEFSSFATPVPDDDAYWASEDMLLRSVDSQMTRVGPSSHRSSLNNAVGDGPSPLPSSNDEASRSASVSPRVRRRTLTSDGVLHPSADYDDDEDHDDHDDHDDEDDELETSFDRHQHSPSHTHSHAHHHYHHSHGHSHGHHVPHIPHVHHVHHVHHHHSSLHDSPYQRHRLYSTIEESALENMEEYAQNVADGVKAPSAPSQKKKSLLFVDSDDDENDDDDDVVGNIGEGKSSEEDEGARSADGTAVDALNSVNASPRQHGRGRIHSEREQKRPSLTRQQEVTGSDLAQSRQESGDKRNIDGVADDEGAATFRQLTDETSL